MMTTQVKQWCIRTQTDYIRTEKRFELSFVSGETQRFRTMPGPNPQTSEREDTLFAELKLEAHCPLTLPKFDFFKCVTVKLSEEPTLVSADS